MAKRKEKITEIRCISELIAYGQKVLAAEGDIQVRADFGSWTVSMIVDKGDDGHRYVDVDSYEGVDRENTATAVPQDHSYKAWNAKQKKWFKEHGTIVGFPG